MVHSSRCFRTHFCIFLCVCVAFRAWLDAARIVLAVGVKSPAVPPTAILNGVDEQPEIQQTERRQAKQRWFRFRLSTVLILTAIVAWGMASGPFFYFELESVHKPGGPVGEWFVPLRAPQAKRVPAPWRPLERWRGVSHQPLLDSPEYWDSNYQATGPHFNRDVLWPALALATFLAWKAAWAVVERRRRGSVARE